MKEEWHDIEGYENSYQVSNLGRVRSCDRIVKYSTGGVRLLKSIIIKPQPNLGDYMQVNLYTNSIPIRITIHRFVAKYFVEGYDEGYEVNHLDGDKSNNRYDNLEWCSKADNIQHAFDTGLIPKMLGSSNPATKLTEEKVLEIDKLISEGVLQKDIAKLYNVCIKTVSNIKLRRNWKKVLTRK